MSSLDAHDTIAAIASPPGRGFRGIVRLSGPDAIAIARRGFVPDDPEGGGTSRRPRRVAGGVRLSGVRPILPASLLLWPGRRSYTGEPVAEIHTLASPPLLGAVLSHCLEGGARLAERGEFTLRAFLSGRLDLTRAEAVLGVIEARNPAQLDAALRQLAGGIHGQIAALRDRLLDALAHLEAGLDFSEESDVTAITRNALAESLARGSAELAELSDRLRGRERASGTPRVVLVGPPNAGKSRLFNALAGETVAIVSPIPGTTRDYLTAACSFDGVELTLIDTAGVDAPRSSAESRAQSLREEQASAADLLLACLPAGERCPETLVVATDRPVLHITTKVDLDPSAVVAAGALATSAETGAGVDALRRAIALALRGRGDEDAPLTTTGARCRGSLSGAAEALASASAALALGAGDELVAVDLRHALDELGKVVGDTVTDDILDRIFERFCIGK